MNKKIKEIVISFDALNKHLGLPEGTFVVGVLEREHQQLVIKVVSDVEIREIQLEDGDDLKRFGEAFKGPRFVAKCNKRKGEYEKLLVAE